jgi:hypothetical protein
MATKPVGGKPPAKPAPAPKPAANGGATPPAKPGAPAAPGAPAPGAAPPAGGGTADAAFAKSQADALATSRADTLSNLKTNNAIAALGMFASTQAALLKLKTDLNDAMNNFVKGIGASVKSASQ